LGTLPTHEARSIALERGLDLVEIGPNAKPPVTKILDFGKFKYEIEKKQKSKPTHSGEIKEIRLGVATDEHDFNTKVEQAKKFVEKGYKVKVTVKMSGRQNIYHQKAIEQINRVQQVLDAEIEQSPTRLGNRFTALLVKRKAGSDAEAKPN
jgi:translation initiation factor IF-3